MSREEEIRQIQGIWFSKGGGSVIPVPPLAFFDNVPDDLEFGLVSLYPFTQTDVLRKLIKPYPEILDYLQEHPMPSGTMKQCLEWASHIGMILFRSDYSLLYCNQLTTCHTDEVELKRAIAGLPEEVINHWPKDLQIEVCLGNELDVRPISRTWAELTMSHLTSGQRFAFSLPPVTPQVSTEPTGDFDVEDEAEPAVRSGSKSAIQRELDKIAAGSTAERESPRHTSTAAPFPRTPPLPPPRPASPPASPSQVTINPLRVTLVLAGVIFCGFLVATHWHDSDEATARQVETKRESNSADDPVARLVAMTPAQAHAYGYAEIQPHYDQMVAAVRGDLYPGSVTNEMRRRGGKTELTPANVAEEMRKIYVEVARDPEVQAELPSKAARAGVSEQVMDSYLQGRLAGVLALNWPANQAAQQPAEPQGASSAMRPPSEDTDQNGTKAAKASPLGDLVVQRRKSKEDDYGDAEIWLACADGSRPSERLCSHDWRSGQVSFSPDEHWIVVTDGGGPGSSTGTTLRAFYRETQNVYHEMEDAGIEDRAAEVALRLHNAPLGAELDHTYAEVAGWSAAGGVLEVNVWGHGSGYGHLDVTKVDVAVSALRANYHRASAEIRNVAPVQAPPQSTIVPATARREPEKAAKSQADAELNTVYARLMAASGPAQQKRLRDEERAWIKWRDAEADRVTSNSAGAGNSDGKSHLRVIATMNQNRARDLRLLLQNSTASGQLASAPSRASGVSIDQTEAETIKHPVRAQITLARGGQMYGTQAIGNVEVTYMDGTKDYWTTNGNCGQSHVAADGTVGWTVYDPERKAATASYSTRPDKTLVLCKQGRTLSKITSALGYIEDWHFLNDGSEIGLRTRALHGVALIERHSSATGELLESVKAYESGLPAWALPFADR